MMIVVTSFALAATVAVAIWLAMTDNAIYALPLVVVIAGLARIVTRCIVGKRIVPADMPPVRHGES